MSAKQTSTARELRELCVRAYHRELAGEIHDLERVFAAWRRGDADAVDVRDAVGTFHAEQMSRLKRLYDACSDERLVARALARGFLQRSELTAELADDLHASVRDVQRLCGTSPLERGNPGERGASTGRRRRVERRVRAARTAAV